MRVSLNSIPYFLISGTRSLISTSLRTWILLNVFVIPSLVTVVIGFKVSVLGRIVTSSIDVTKGTAQWTPVEKGIKLIQKEVPINRSRKTLASIITTLRSTVSSTMMWMIKDYLGVKSPPSRLLVQSRCLLSPRRLCAVSRPLIQPRKWWKRDWHRHCRPASWGSSRTCPYTGMTTKSVGSAYLF